MMDTTIIILIIVGVVLLAVGGFLLYKFVFVPKSYLKQIKDLETRYSYLSALMIGQDSQYIKRLEMISRTNLLYVEIYSDYLKKYKRVTDVDDVYAQSVLKQLKNMVEAKQYKDIKEFIAEARKAINTYETNATALDSELKKLIRPEEESRSNALALKSNLRAVKLTYNTNIGDLKLVSESFEKVFDKLDRKFDEFESYVDGAEYEDANAILPMLDKVINQLAAVLEVMPSLCILITHVIPDRIANLKKETEDLNFRKYPTHHLMVNQHFDSYDRSLEELRIKLINLQTSGVKEKADEMIKDIDGLEKAYQDEIDAKDYFEANCNITYQNVLNLENNFLRICSILPEMNRLYKIGQNEQERIEDLKHQISSLGNSKRNLDTFIHSSTQQPYSILREKLEKLIEDYDRVYQDVSNFKVFLDSLRSSSEEAYSLVFSYYYRLKQYEQKIHAVNLPEYTAKYVDKINDCYNLLDDIDKIIKVTPIDVALVNEKVEEFKIKANEIFDDVDKETNLVHLAESAIVYANRDRIHQADVHQQLILCENQFFEAEFEKTYRDVVQLLKKRHVDDNQSE